MTFWFWFENMFRGAADGEKTTKINESLYFLEKGTKKRKRGLPMWRSGDAGDWNEQVDYIEMYITEKIYNYYYELIHID